jgi:protein TonB
MMAPPPRDISESPEPSPDQPIKAVGTRRPYRVPLGMPGSRQDWRAGSAVSVIAHVVLLLLIIGRLTMPEVFEIPQGAGGDGPAGGGGGGTRGSGRVRAEQLEFVRVQEPVPAPPTVPKVELPVPKPVLPQLTMPQLSAPKQPELTMPTGIGGGTGSDGTAGSGPGTGGGVGTGVGTGRGSSEGPGTGGGNQANFPPTLIEMFLPPMPVPASVKGHRLIAEFDVDERGKVLSVAFNETRDRGYNGRLRDALKGYRFRPGHRPDGTPIRMKAQVIAELY